jgi:hypothetical protein
VLWQGLSIVLSAHLRQRHSYIDPADREGVLYHMLYHLTTNGGTADGGVKQEHPQDPGMVVTSMSDIERPCGGRTYTAPRTRNRYMYTGTSRAQSTAACVGHTARDCAGTSKADDNKA